MYRCVTVMLLWPAIEANAKTLPPAFSPQPGKGRVAQNVRNKIRHLAIVQRFPVLPLSSAVRYVVVARRRWEDPAIRRSFRIRTTPDSHHDG